MTAADPRGADALPTLASILLVGGERTTPVRINDFIHRSPDISHSYLVTTGAGDLIVNTGATGAGALHRDRYRAVSSAPVRYILLTQSHLDHVGGVPELREPDTLLVTQERFREIVESRRRLAPFWQRRKDRLLKPLLGARMVSEFIDVDQLQPDITFATSLDLALGERRFQLIHVPGGETLDSMVVWMPHERILFSGNMFGPIVGDLPNLYTIRGERIRSATEFVRCVDLVLGLDPLQVLEGHGEEPLAMDTFRNRATRVRDAVEWLHGWTIDGMNAGKDLRTLMSEAALPPSLDVPQRHGKVAWCVRAIWEEYVGWFEFDSTTSLSAVPAAAVHPDLVALAGGPDPLVARARVRFDAGEPLHALHLVEIALTASPEHRRALELVVEIHTRLLDASGRLNYFETLWMESSVTEARERLAALDVSPR